MSVILSTAYCPPISYIAAMARELTLSADGVIPSNAVIEACENYQKQSWRNRTRILSAGGPMDLSFPIVHVGGTHNNIPIREVLIDYTTDWVTLHERAIASAYFSSPYFEYYKDEFFAILDSRPATLFGLNTALLDFFLEKTGVPCKISFTEDYVRETGLEDLRETIHPKRPDTVLRDLGLDRPYWQVFGDRYGFTPGLSVMDLLFNEGPDSILWLKKL
ncbi:MAG: WbqC family protein [Bacteroidales bacterium]|nr:WbqC family protein [Bacteroidales bacterium]